MLPQIITPLTFIAALGCGIISGIMFAFSHFIMEALGKLSAAQGVAAMQSINSVIINPFFLGVFMGTAILCLLLGGAALFDLQQAGALWRLTGAIFYIVGSIVVTVAFNIPLNNALDTVNSSSVEGATLWERYLTVWTRWNHVRTLAAIAATACFIFGFRS